MQFVEYLRAGTIAAYLPERADATPTFTVLDSEGSTRQTSASVTLDTVSTTLSAAALAGAATVTVASATGITAGRKYLIGGLESVGGELVTCKSVSSTTVTLARPLRLAKASGAAFVCTRLTCAVAATVSTKCQRNLRCAVTWTVSTAARETFLVPFDVTRYVPRSYLFADDAFSLDPLLAKRVPAGLWLPDLQERAWDMLLRRIAGKVAPGAVVGVLDLTTPHAYLVRYLLAEVAGTATEVTDHRDYLAKRFEQELEAVLGTVAVDENQDGATSAWERWPRGIPLVRS